MGDHWWIRFINIYAHSRTNPTVGLTGNCCKSRPPTCIVAAYSYKSYCYKPRRKASPSDGRAILCMLPRYKRTNVPSSFNVVVNLRRGPQMWGHKLMAIILSNLNRFTIFFTARFLGKFAVNWLLNIPTTHGICCRTTLRNINVRKQAINDKTTM